MIHVKGDWYIEIDERTYNLMQFSGTYVDKDGRVCSSYKNTTYHATLEQALNQYIRYAVRDALSQEDLEIKDAIRVLHDEVEKIRKDLTVITQGI